MAERNELLHLYFDDLWRDLAGKPGRDPLEPLPSYDFLMASEWDYKFERLIRSRVSTEDIGEFFQLMHNRVIMGAFRYGLWVEKRQHKNIESCINRYNRFCSDGNTEHLVDIANLCMKEFSAGGSRTNQYIAGIRSGLTWRSDMLPLLYRYLATPNKMILIAAARRAIKLFNQFGGRRNLRAQDDGGHVDGC